jgi:hypothetical protein
MLQSRIAHEVFENVALEDDSSRTQIYGLKQFLRYRSRALPQRHVDSVLRWKCKVLALFQSGRAGVEPNER